MSTRVRRIQAAVARGIETPLQVESVDLAGAGEKELVVRTRACAICHSDIAFTEGKWGEFPATVFGHEIAGVVEEVGRGAAFAVGDSVLVSLIRSCGVCPYCRSDQAVLCEAEFALDRCSPLTSTDQEPIGHGLRCAGFAEYVTVHASQVVKIPASVPFAAASVVACAGVTGMGAVLNTAALPETRNVAVIGAGGVGINSIQAAALRAPRSLIAVDVSETKLDLASRFGATHTALASDDPAGLVRGATEGRGADYVFVTVGAPAAVRQALSMTARGGTIVLVGMPATGALVEIEPSTVAADEIRILGSKMGSTHLARDVPRIFEWHEQGRIRLADLVSETYALADINEAFEAANRPETIRVAIEFGGE